MKKISIFILLFLTLLTSCNNEEHKHQYVGEKVESTCIEQGYTTYICECGDSYVDDYVDAKGHTEEVIPGVASTCDETGLTEGKKCSVCHEILLAQETILATGHSYDKVVTAPTCEAKGYTTYTCTCGDSYVDNYVDALGHTEEVIPAVSSTCDETGLTEGKKCTVCQKVLLAQETVAAKGHDYDEVIYKWSNDHKSVTATRVCKNDNTHVETETVSSTYEVVTEATCTKTGSGKYTSESFKNKAFSIQIYEETIVATGHSYKSVVTAPTCEAKGYTTYTCTCGDSYVDNYVDALGHKEEVIPGVASTCDETGLTEGKKCTVCQKVLLAQESVAAKGHSYKSVVTEATCEAKGYTTHICACGDEYIDDYVDSLGHSFTEYKSDNNATPEKDGTKTAICDRDGCEATDVIIEKYNKFAQLSYVALGDSITYGYEPFTGRLMENPYPSLVAETLGLKSVLNYGIPGDTVGYHPNWKVMANRYVEMDDEANIVSVLAGINDYRYATIPLGDIDDDTIYTIYGAYNVLAKGLIEKYPDSFIFFMTPYKWADDKGECAQGYSLEDMSNCIKEVCKKYNIPVLDLYTYGELENEFGTSGSDGLHPTQNFLIEKTAPQISEFIESNYGKIDYTIEEEVDYSQLSYTAFGDSITYGIDGVNGGRMASPYPSLVADALGLKAVYNKGISGATYCINNLNRTNMTARILSYTDQADIISLMLGVNDYYVGLPLGDINSKDNTTIYGSLDLIANHLTTNYSDSFIFFMTPFKIYCYDKNNTQNYKLEAVSNAIKYVAGKYNIPVLDIFEEGNYEAEMYLDKSDGIHPSQQFFIEYTVPQITDFIKENYGEIDYTPKEEIDFSELKFTAFGDSITYGADLIIGGRVENPYPTVLSNILGLESYENRGVSGATLTTNNQGLTCMTNIITSYTSQTDIIGVLGGVNDFNRKLPLGDIDDNDTSTIYGALHVGMSYLSENYRDSFIFYMTPYKEDFSGNFWSTDNSAGYNLIDVSNAIKEVAAIYDIAVLDLLETGNFESIMYDDDCDGIHPNQAFITNVMAPQIAQFIKDNYK